jgi:deazaflavin-dependent oxidoreductase (nitroreductase family)
MPDEVRRPLRRRVQATAFRIVNVPMRLVLGLPFGTPLGRSLMLGYIVGRKSGKTYRQPLSYVRDGEFLLTPGGGRWKLNLVTGQPVRLRVRGTDITVTPELVGDPAEADALLMTMVAVNPRAASFIGVARTPDGHFDRAGLEQAIRYGFRIVRWHPAKS